MNNIIDTTEQLSNFCEQLLAANPEFISVDTEFISSHKYKRFPKLCLLQICHQDTSVIIDALAHNIDLSILKKILFNPRITKVFHDVKHDVLTLLPIFEQIPYPIMDTQMMAMMGNYYQNHISYFETVQTHLGITLDKDHTRTDWSQRPLSTEQIDYALADVIHLYTLYQHLHKKLSNSEKIQWLYKDCEDMVNNLAIPYSTKNDFEFMTRQILTNHRTYNKLIDNVSDATIYKTANSNKYIRSNFQKIVQPEHLSALEKKLKKLQNIEYSVDSNKKAIIHIIQLFIDQFAKANHISYSLLASTSEISRMVNKNMTNIRLLSGWRYEAIGKQVLNILQGQDSLHLKIRDGNAKITINP